MPNMILTIPNDKIGDVIAQLVMKGLTFTATTNEDTTTIELTGGY